MTNENEQYVITLAKRMCNNNGVASSICCRQSLVFSGGSSPTHFHLLSSLEPEGTTEKKGIGED